MIKEWIKNQLASLARSLVAKYKPKVIGVTGSVGKTSSRDAIFAVVSMEFTARKPLKNFNNEFGLPFSILGEDSPGRNPLKWLFLFVRGIRALWFGPFPKVLVLEMGVDKPGDMDYLLGIVKPDIGVITSIGLSHYEFFKSMEAVIAEKSKIIEHLSGDKVAVLNADNTNTASLANKTKVRTLQYSIRSRSDVYLRLVNENLMDPAYSSIEVSSGEANFSLKVPVVGDGHLSAIASAVAVGEALGMSVDSIKQGLVNYKPVPGRLNILSGIKGTVLIDDTYNSSPESTRVALELLARHPAENKIAVLGDMLELGEESETAHSDIGALVAKLRIDKLLLYGGLSKKTADSAITSGMEKKQVLHFSNQDELVKILLTLLGPSTAVLIKGSQGVRMEKVTKELLAQPMTASSVLCRQYGGWLNS